MNIYAACIFSRTLMRTEYKNKYHREKHSKGIQSTANSSMSNW